MTGRNLLKNFVLLAALAGALSACGRKGDLEPPPARTPVVGGTEQPAERPVKDKPFILDKLIQ